MDDTGPTGLDDIIDGVEAVVLANEPMKISDLPTEILDKIMFHLSKRAEVRGSDDVSSTQTQDIKNVRLSCHILSAAASRYLIDRLTVDVSLNSLSHLEEISEHPLICHSVQVVEICLAQYDSSFDNGVQGFIQFIRHHQQQLARQQQPALRHRSSPEMATKARTVSHCWDTYLGVLESGVDTFLGSFDDEIGFIQDFEKVWDTRHTGPLLEGYCQYRSRLLEQASLQQDGFVTRVTASMAKLTGAKHLRITDWDTTAWGRLHGPLKPKFYGIDLSSDLSIVNSLAGSRRSFKYVQGTSLLSMIPSLICAGKEIKSLDIEISPSVISYPELKFSASQEAELRSSLGKLQSFLFENYRHSVENPWNQKHAIPHLGQFIDACLISDNLEGIFINASKCPPFPTRSLFTARTWPKLKSVELEALPVSAADLDVLTKSLASQHPQGYLILDSVNLYCGATWASILDMLRDRRICKILGRYQYGAEFDDDPALCDEVFCNNQWSFTVSLPSFAEYYVQREEMANPLLERPDKELRDKLFGAVPEYWVHEGTGYDFEGLE